jgi:hypothetical protein
MDQADRGMPLAGHLCGEGQRGSVVVGTAVPDADDDAIRCRPIAVRLASRRLEIDRVGAFRSLRVLDHLTTFRQDRLRPMIAHARFALRP